MSNITGKHLITTDAYFYAPDGKQYRAAYGEVKVMATKEVLGFDPNRNSANWFVRVGDDKDYVLLAGCQIHYAVRTDILPASGTTEEIWEGKKQVTDIKIYVPGQTEKKTRITEVGYLPKPLINHIRGLTTGFFRSLSSKTDLINKLEVEGFLDYKFINIGGDSFLEIYWNEEERNRYVI